MTTESWEFFTISDEQYRRRPLYERNRTEPFIEWQIAKKIKLPGIQENIEWNYVTNIRKDELEFMYEEFIKVEGRIKKFKRIINE